MRAASDSCSDRVHQSIYREKSTQGKVDDEGELDAPQHGWGRVSGSLWQRVLSRRAEYVIRPASIPMVAQGIPETEKYLRFDYVVFRKDLEGTYKLAGSGMAKGLPRQTLKIVQDRARRFIEEDLVERAMRPRISIHEVPSPNPFIETMADFWQPRNEVWRISRRELEKVAELTPWQVNDWFVQRSIDVELDQVPQVLLITLLLTDAD